MTRWRGSNPGFVAARMVEAVKAGDLQTRGQWITFADTLASFPPSLREWTINQIQPVLGEDGTQYLLSFASTPRPKYAIVQEAEA